MNISAWKSVPQLSKLLRCPHLIFNSPFHVILYLFHVHRGADFLLRFRNGAPRSLSRTEKLYRMSAGLPSRKTNAGTCLLVMFAISCIGILVPLVQGTISWQCLAPRFLYSGENLLGYQTSFHPHKT